MGIVNEKQQKLDKLDLEITLEKIYQHLLIERDRKINELAQKEIEQRDLMKQKELSYEDVQYQFLEITSLFNYIRAIKIIMNFSKVLKNHSIQICKAQKTGEFESLKDIQSYMESIIWSSNKINKQYIKDFEKLVQQNFGMKVFEELQKYQFIDKNLQSLLEDIEPSKKEIDLYLEKFIFRYRIKMKDFKVHSIDTQDFSQEIQNLKHKKENSEYEFDENLLNQTSDNYISPYTKYQKSNSQQNQNSNDQDETVNWLIDILDEQNSVQYNKNTTAMDIKSHFGTREFLPIDEKDRNCHSQDINKQQMNDENFNQYSVNLSEIKKDD